MAHTRCHEQPHAVVPLPRDCTARDTGPSFQGAVAQTGLGGRGTWLGEGAPACSTQTCLVARRLLPLWPAVVPAPHSPDLKLSRPHNPRARRVRCQGLNNNSFWGRQWLSHLHTGAAAAAASCACVGCRPKSRAAFDSPSGPAPAAGPRWPEAEPHTPGIQLQPQLPHR